MSRDARIDLDWADGTYSFRLPWAQLAALQEACDAGPYVVLQRLTSGTWRVEDISNVIRLGLIGGGMPVGEALKKVRFYVEDRPPLENVPIAQSVLMVALVGAPEEDLGNVERANQESELTISPTES